MSDGPDEGRSRDLLTVPNALGALRLVASPLLVPLGATGRETAFLLLFLTLTFTDWVDGKLAIWLEQRSATGARLDSLADGVMYASLLLGLGWLEGPVLVEEWPWIAAGVGSYAVSCGVSVWKFGSVPSYHTRTAKASWFLSLAAVVALLLGEWVWPLRVAALAVTVTNVEGVLVTRILERPREDVSSLADVLRREGRTRTDPGQADRSSGAQ